MKKISSMPILTNLVGFHPKDINRKFEANPRIGSRGVKMGYYIVIYVTLPPRSSLAKFHENRSYKFDLNILEKPYINASMS